MTHLDMMRAATVKAIATATGALEAESDPELRVHYHAARLPLIYLREAIDAVIAEEMPR